MSPKNYQIILENNQLLAINKPTNCHSTGDDSLESILLADNLLNSQIENNGLVQRLDYETSGLIVAAKTTKTYKQLKKIISEHLWKKTYLVVIEGVPDRDLIHSAYLGSRHRGSQKVSLSQKSKDRFLYAEIKAQLQIKLTDKYSLLKVSTSYGRRHQVRVMMADLGYPLLGDELYGSKHQTTELSPNLPKFILHAENIKTILMKSNYFPSKLSCPIPDYLADYLSNSL